MILTILIPLVFVLTIIVAVLIYKRRLHRKCRNKKKGNTTPTLVEDAPPPSSQSHETGESAYVNFSACANETDPQQNNEQVNYVNMQVNELADVLNQNQPQSHNSFYEAMEDSDDNHLAAVQDEELYLAPIRNSASTIPDGKIH